MKTTTEMKLIPIGELIQYINNARTHSPEQINKLRASLREFGFINPVIIDKDMNIIAGHGRVIAAKEEHISEVPCVLVDYLTEAQKKAYILANNRMALDAGWDEEMLKIEIEALEAADFDALLTGFDEKELADLFKEDKKAEDGDFDLIKALEVASFVERGDVWTVGRHRPYRGMYVTIARWCNQPSFFKKKSLREFALANGKNSSAMRYLREFEEKFHDVSYFYDLKYEKWGGNSG